jgi:hypothetical protein
MSLDLTIGEFLEGILPRLHTDKTFPRWPPDCFALCLALLRRTGAYSQLFLHWPPAGETEGALEKWTTDVRKLGEKWRRAWSQHHCFSDLAAEWQLVCESFAWPLESVSQDRPLLEALMKLVAVADDASESAGAPTDRETGEDDFLKAASVFPEAARAVCEEIDGSRLRVLPRMHTPQNGLTDRSLSLYLSLCHSSEVIPQWLSTPFIQGDSFNLLMVPWPLEVRVSQFRDVTDSAPEHLPGISGFQLRLFWRGRWPP